MKKLKLKKIELSLKNLFDKLIYKKVNTKFIEKPTYFLSFFEGSKILLLRNDRIGDLIVSTPFIYTIRKYNPNVTIDILLSEKNIVAKRAVENYVNNIYVFRKKLFSLIKLVFILKKQKYDLVIDLFDNHSTTNALLIKLIKPLYSLGFRKHKANFYNIEVPLPNKLKHHIVARLNNLLFPFGIESHNITNKLIYNLTDLEIKEAINLVGHKNKPFRLGINISGSNNSKNWGTSNYIEFIERVLLYFDEYEILIFNANDDLKSIPKLILNPDIKFAPETNNFNLFAAMIKTCDILLSPDTAVVHLAAAFQIPCIGLYTFTGSKDTGIPWTPYNSPNKCVKTKTSELKHITIEAVYEAFEELIAEKNLYE